MRLRLLSRAKVSSLAASKGLRAYTMVEVIVAVLIVGLTGVSLYLALCDGFGIVGMTREKLRGTQVMLRKSEAVRLCNWTQLGTFSFAAWSNPSGVSTNGGGIFYAGTLATNSAATIIGNTTYTTDIRWVTISVVWTNYTMGRAIVRTNQMQTLVARRGMHNYIWGAE